MSGLSTEFLEKTRDTIVQAVLQAGKIVREHHEDPPGVTETDHGVVTDVDRWVSESLFQIWRRDLPNFGIFDEEREDDGSRMNREFCLFVDPLDKTRDYIKGIQTYAISVGLTYQHRPIIGVTLQPYPDGNRLAHAVDTREMRYAKYQVDGQDPMDLRVSDSQTIDLLFSNQRTRPKIKKAIDIINPNSRTPMGGSVNKLVAIARGEGNLYMCIPPDKLGMEDVCASQVILEAAGGKITDMHGGALDFSQFDTHFRKGVIASNTSIHRRVIGLIRPYD